MLTLPTQFSPIISISYCSPVSCIASSGVRGHEKEPSSSLLYKSKNPLLSHRRPLIRFPRPPQKRKSTFFSNGFMSYLVPISCARPSIPFRGSVLPQAIIIFETPAASASMTDHLKQLAEQRIRCGI